MPTAVTISMRSNRCTPIMDELLLKAVLAGSLIALFTGPLGCLVVWRRLAFFGDALAHSALLGVALSLVTELPPGLAVALTAASLAILLLYLRSRSKLADDTLLGILSHSALALGLVTLTLFESSSVNWMGYLFGDILAVGWGDVLTASLLGLLVVGLLAWFWQSLVLISIDRDLARVDGVAVDRLELLFMLLLAVAIAVAIKIIGVLLITAMLVIPAATARYLAHSPGQMARMATAVGLAAVWGGISAAFQWDLPTGPAIVVTALLLFLLATLVRRPTPRTTPT